MVTKIEPDALKRILEEHAEWIVSGRVRRTRADLGGRVPHFFATNERALEDIRACAADSIVAEEMTKPLGGA